ncbi:MAG: class I SAM-dependent methyltransferase [Gemmatimonadales bacterium]|nr:class I SAM-dependent methyltransferase [Gemmatimonadales bacterium]
MTTKSHWEAVYAKRAPHEVSWYQANPEHSLALLDVAGATSDTRIVDVGGGASCLVDCLLDRGFTNLTVMDIAEGALAHAKVRLGKRARDVQWIEADVTAFEPSERWDIWHDRAVFHFLTAAQDREAYRRTLDNSLVPGGHAVIATFGPQGPTRCSGLDVVRYSAQDLLAELGSVWELAGELEELHQTPQGVIQEFMYGLFRFGSEE